jgi:hypothetical protein
VFVALLLKMLFVLLELLEKIFAVVVVFCVEFGRIPLIVIG